MEVTPQISQLLTGALEYQRRGDLAGAEAACRAILKKDPGASPMPFSSLA